ncbi:uncharacterized protein [Misgurnus anguillicaudatus]|uniref:uncharacterized protein isoform X2 n=1 Tax=Misgurnus anguillicaudatus TaxID=75329 RepID=UPI003CCF952F
MAPGSRTLQCSACSKEIGSASKTCKYCGVKILQKKNLKAQKEKFDDQWAAKLKKHGNSNKIMNCVDLLLHKMELLGFSPMLFITSQRGQHRSTKVFVKNVNIQRHHSVPVMQRLYEAVVRASTANNDSPVVLDPALAKNSPSTTNDSSAAPSLDSNVSTSVFVEPISAANDDSSAATNLNSNSSASATNDATSATNDATSAANDPASAVNDSTDATNDSAPATNDSADAATNDSAPAANDATSDSAPDANDSADDANNSAPATNNSANDSAPATNDPATAANANVFYMPTQRKRKQKNNGKKRISFPMAALYILWQEVEEYLGLRGSHAVVPVGQYCLC